MHPTEIHESTKSFFEDIDWQSIFSFKNILDNILLFGVGFLLMIVFHFIGKWLAHVIDSRVTQSEKDRLKKQPSSPDEEENETEDAEDSVFNKFKYRSRDSLASLAGQVVYFVTLVIGFSIVLGVIGIQVATIIAIVSTVGISIGFAVQGTLSDIASGILLALFQTYEVGDIIKIGDREGRVVDFRMINTLLQDVPTMTLVTIPNRVIQESIVVNYSRSNYHMFTFDVCLSNHLNRDFNAIYETIRRDLSDKKKYSEIYRKEGLDVFVGIHDLSKASTMLRVMVPMLPKFDLDRARMNILSKVRHTMKKNGITMVEFR